LILNVSTSANNTMLDAVAGMMDGAHLELLSPDSDLLVKRAARPQDRPRRCASGLPRAAMHLHERRLARP
jgi:hypothetical protein